MAIDITNWVALLKLAGAYRLEVYEPDDRLDFFVYIPPTKLINRQMLRDTYHLHVFLESDLATTAIGQQVAIRIATILPKTANFPHNRPNLADLAPNTWANTVQFMNPAHPATTAAARRFARLVGAFQTNHAEHGDFAQMG